MISKSTTIGLFDRVQGDVLRPLSGQNRARMWGLLVDLYDGFFGPDAALVPEDGFTHRTITRAIEDHLLTHSDWVEEGVDPLTPASVRANLTMDRLIETGWLKEERIGVRNFIVMRPAVGKFLEHLKQYAEDGPADVGGSIQIIHNTLKEAERDPEGQAPAFRRAAKEARDLLAMLNNTHVRVREVMATLNTEASTAAYVRAFFDDYISGIFIRDYRDLRTTNHPLRNRHEVLRIVGDLRDDHDRRARLAAGYQKLLKTTDAEVIDLAMAKDFDRFKRFEDIELYLQRLDGGVTRATRQALAYITYRLRTRDRIERLIAQSAEAVVTCGEELIAAPWQIGTLFSERMLREPAIRRPPPPRVPIKKREPTIEERALWNLQRLMVRNREVTGTAALEYLGRQFAGRQRLTSDQLLIGSIHDLVVFAALARVALHRARAGTSGSDIPLSRALKDYRITLEEGATTDNEFLTVPRFTVALEKRT
jgi:hypothetical protein